MAQTENETGEKTQAPSGKRVSQARGDGMIGRSMDLSQIMGMTAAFIALQYIGPLLWNDLQIIMRSGFTSRYTSDPLSIIALKRTWFEVIRIVLPHVLLLLFIAALFGAGCTAVQTKFNWSWKLIKPKMSMLNPLAGIKRILSGSNAFQLGKSILKIFVIAPLAYFAFMDLFPALLGLINVPIVKLLPFTSQAMQKVFWSIAKFMFVLGVVDLAYQKWNTFRQIKMTRVEVKEEKKATEGDEETKRTLQQKGLLRIRERMLKAVRHADVVVTNPTHIAVALQYDFTPGAAPRVVAKGRAHLAERIKELARLHGVPVIERKPLARALYKSVEVGHSIPFELYQAVAELLAYVYKLKGINPFRRRSQSKPASAPNRRDERSKRQ